MFAKTSIQLKFSLVFLVAIGMVVAALLVGVQSLKERQLRNEAVAVAEQVVAFRAWVANTGVVWVDQLHADFADFLGKRADAQGNFFFSKNPALATRELSAIVGKSATRATFRVTSDEYRNPANAPDEFESGALQAFKADDDVKTMEAFEGQVYRFATPIYVKPSCLRCHGNPEDAPPEVIAKYGDKRAFGYKVGDVRGIISVQLPDITLQDVMRTFLNPYTLVLVIAAFALNFVYTQFSIIRRLRSLSAKTIEISKGEMDLELGVRQGSRDEIDKVTHAVDLLRRSLAVAMKHLT